MLKLFLEVAFIGKVVNGAVLKVTILSLADAIFQRGRVFKKGFRK